MEVETESTPKETPVVAATSLLNSVSTFDIIVVGLVLIAIYLWWRNRSSSPPTPSPSSSFKVVPAATTPMVSESNFITKMKNTGRNVIVFYGSQTGTAEDFATRLAKEAARFGMKGLAVDPEECDMELLSQLSTIEKSLAIFCMATYGEGDPTDNAQEFYDWLRNTDVDLSGLKFTVFGLGNKTYEHFNAMGIAVDERLAKLGGQRMFRLGQGDDDANIEEDFVTWKEEMWQAVCAEFGISPEAIDVHLRQYQLQTLAADYPREKIYTGEVARLGSYKNQRPPYDAKNPFLAAITVNRELHAGGDRSCMHIELDITGARIRYECGDHVAIAPSNDSSLVDAIGRRLNVDLDQVISLVNVDEDSSKRHPFPCPCSYRTALTHYLDICMAPKTNVLNELAEFATDPSEKEFLRLLGSPDPAGKARYTEWILKDRRHILAVLEDLPSVMPPLDYLCELLPRLQVRYYSISSSPKLHPTSIHVTAVVVDYKTRVGRQMCGVATGWLKNLCPAGEHLPRVPIYVRRSQFRLPYKVATSLIMVGPGTGFAPFRGFIQERNVAKSEGKPVGAMDLFFGCRHEAEDFIYRSEIEAAQKDGVLRGLHVAFSRDQAEKVYVQHLMRQADSRRQIWEVLNGGGHVYVCGDARNMARDVHATLVDIVTTEGGKEPAQALEFVKNLQNTGRYASDVWS